MDSRDTSMWWQGNWPKQLSVALLHINKSRQQPEDNYYKRCLEMLKGLKQIWTAYYDFREGRDTLSADETNSFEVGMIPSDSLMFCQIMQHGISDDARQRLANEYNLDATAADFAKLWTPSQERHDLCQSAWPMLEAMSDALLDHCSTRLASYGTLRPGESNYHVVADIEGTWLDGQVRGSVADYKGYPLFRWSVVGEPIEVKILASDRLPEHYPRIDHFEGADYCRILVPVELAENTIVCNIYAGLDHLAK